MGALTALGQALRGAIAEWDLVRLEDLQFARADTARLLLLGFLGLALLVWLARMMGRRGRPGGRIALPALLSWVRPARWSFVRHGALLLALAGLPFFALALADPRTAMVQREALYPGRRISLMIDASSSMLAALPARTLAKGAPNDAVFFTTVAAAKYFVQLRMQGRYHDLMALVEFGDDAYVITPFTNDYENILLSISLIGDWNEFMAFPDQGTIIARAIDQSVGLFQAFDFLDASGNLMVIFTDGVDAEVTQDGKTALDVLKEAARAKIPVFFIRTGGSKAAEQAVPDAVWAAAVARTGGRFYAAADEATIVRAIHEIDQAAGGSIRLRQYSTQQPRFSPFALAAVGLWGAALLLRFTVPYFQTFP